MVFNIRFAPLNIPFVRRVQTAVVTFELLLIPFVCIALNLLCIFTPFLWVVYIPYLIWIYFDTAPQRGGRSLRWLRRLGIWQYFRDYFPTQLTVETKLDPTKRYLFLCHPHGIISLSVWANFTAEAYAKHEYMKGIDVRVVTLETNFKIPFWREYVLSMGFIGSSRQAIDNALALGKSADDEEREKRENDDLRRASLREEEEEPEQKRENNLSTLRSRDKRKDGRQNKKGSVDQDSSKAHGPVSAVIVVGGAAESLEARPGVYRLTLNRRKGFVRVGLAHGCSLVPVFSFGENDLYDQVDNPKGSSIRKWQNVLLRKLGFATPLFKGRGMFNYDFGLLPHRCKVHTFVGEPIDLPLITNPSEEEVDRYHALYVSALQALFERHRKEMGETANLEIVE